MRPQVTGPGPRPEVCASTPDEPPPPCCTSSVAKSWRPGGSIPEPHQGEGVPWAEGGGAPRPALVSRRSCRRPRPGGQRQRPPQTCPLQPGASPEPGGKQEWGWRAAGLPETLPTPRSTSRALWGRQAACLHPIHQQDPGPQALPLGPSSFPRTPETPGKKGHRLQHRALAGPAAGPLSRPRPADLCLTQWNIRAGKYLFWKKEMAASPKGESWGATCAPKGSALGR